MKIFPTVSPSPFSLLSLLFHPPNFRYRIIQRPPPLHCSARFAPGLPEKNDAQVHSALLREADRIKECHRTSPTQLILNLSPTNHWYFERGALYISLHPSIGLSLRLSPASSATWVRLSNRQSEQQHQLPDSSSVFVNRAIFSQTLRANIFERVFFLFKKRR